MRNATIIIAISSAVVASAWLGFSAGRRAGVAAAADSVGRAGPAATQAAAGPAATQPAGVSAPAAIVALRQERTLAADARESLGKAIVALEAGDAALAALLASQRQEVEQWQQQKESLAARIEQATLTVTATAGTTRPTSLPTTRPAGVAEGEVIANVDPVALLRAEAARADECAAAAREAVGETEALRASFAARLRWMRAQYDAESDHVAGLTRDIDRRLGDLAE